MKDVNHNIRLTTEQIKQFKNFNTSDNCSILFHGGRDESKEEYIELTIIDNELLEQKKNENSKI